MNIFLKSNIFLLFSKTILEIAAQYVDCGQYMEHIISGPNGVSDESLSATSTAPNVHGLHDPKYGRLYMNRNYSSHASAWTAGVNNRHQYLQVSFERQMVVCAILTQGREENDEWIKTFSIGLSPDGVKFGLARDSYQTILFDGNTDGRTVVRNDFDKCVLAKILKIKTRSWHNRVTLRMGFLGCTKRRSDLLLLKKQFGVKKIETWKRTSTFMDNTRYISKQISPHIGSCAISCHQMSLCVDYTFNQNDHSCVLLPGQPSQNKGNAVESNIFSRYNYFADVNGYAVKYIRNQHVYYKIITERKKKREASEICEGDNGRLLVVDNSEIMAFIQDDIKTNLILSQEQEYFVNGYYNGAEWMFDTNQEVPVDLWGKNPIDDCIVVTEHDLETRACDLEYYFVCELLISNY